MSEQEPAMICKEIANRLTRLRLDKAWTREYLAEQAGINVHTLKRFERTGQISLERLVSLCQVLDVLHEFVRAFKPRHRVSVENWEVMRKPLRKRGRRRLQQVAELIDAEPIEA